MDIAQCSELPVTLVFLPAHDIAMFVGEGNVDMGITGLDVVKETSDDNEIEVAMVSKKTIVCIPTKVSVSVLEIVG